MAHTQHSSHIEGRTIALTCRTKYHKKKTSKWLKPNRWFSSVAWRFGYINRNNKIRFEHATCAHTRKKIEQFSMANRFLWPFVQTEGRRILAIVKISNRKKGEMLSLFFFTIWLFFREGLQLLSTHRTGKITTKIFWLMVHSLWHINSWLWYL